jgi:general secretion pathway protein K
MSFAAPPAIPRPHRQRGAALLIAMVIVTLVATLAASMVWQQWRAVQTEAAERARIQSAWILSGALDWARLILKEDARNGGADHLGEPWAVPLAEARLSTFLAADTTSTDDAPDAFLSGAISDAQARYNLSNLVAQGKVDPVELAALVRLCEATGAASDVAGRIATGLQSAHAAAGANAVGAAAASAPAAATASAPTAAIPTVDPSAPLLPQTVAQLDFLGIDAEALRTLAPYVVLLPRSTPVNVNTASREVLVAAIKGLDLASAERLIQVRQRTPFMTLPEVERAMPALAPLDASKLSVSSSFFQVRGRLRLGDRALEQTSLVERRGLDVVVLQRERVSSRDQPAS